MSEDDTEDKGNGEEDGRNINITLGKIVAYPVSILLILIGLGSMGSSVVGGGFILVAGVLALPLVRSRIKQSQGVAINRWATIGIVVVLLIAGGAMMGGDDTDDTATAEEIEHQMGDSFEVGEDKAIEYTVHNAYSTDVIYGYEAQRTDEQFIVVEVEMTNVGDESIDISRRNFQTVDSQDRQFDVNRDAIHKVDSDERFQVDGITFEQLDPGVSAKGLVVFEMPANETDIRFKIEPVGVFSTADEHYVELEIEEIEG